jgi:hypothetical protein
VALQEPKVSSTTPMHVEQVPCFGSSCSGVTCSHGNQARPLEGTLLLAATAHPAWKLKLTHTEALTTPATKTLTLGLLSSNPEVVTTPLGVELDRSATEFTDATMLPWRRRCQLAAAHTCGTAAISHAEAKVNSKSSTMQTASPWQSRSKF